MVMLTRGPLLIHRVGLPVSPRRLAGLERRLGRQIPDPYYAFLTVANGGRPYSAWFTVPGASPTERQVEAFYGLSSGLDEVSDLEEELTSPGSLPSSLFPFCYDNDYKNLYIETAPGDHKGLIYYYDREEWREPTDHRPLDVLLPVAASLEDFLAHLHHGTSHVVEDDNAQMDGCTAVLTLPLPPVERPPVIASIDPAESGSDDYTVLRELLRDADLGPIENKLLRLSRLAVGLYTTGAIDENALPVGSTKLGGCPDLPRHVQWPHTASPGSRTAHRPYQIFVAQINLADVAMHNVMRLLPATGILTFFYDPTAAQVPPFQSNGLVLYHTSPHQNEDWERKAPPNESVENQEGSLLSPPLAMFTARIITLPTCVSPLLQQVNMTRAEEELYTYFWYHLEPLFLHTRHWLGGHPYAIQEDDMPSHCVLRSQGNTGATHATQIKPQQKTEMIRNEANDWQLLLQVASDARSGLQWDDNGILYYWIRRQDLRMRDFSRICVIAQSH